MFFIILVPVSLGFNIIESAPLTQALLLLTHAEHYKPRLAAIIQSLMSHSRRIIFNMLIDTPHATQGLQLDHHQMIPQYVDQYH
jgi:hypothetical protein